MSHTCPLGRYTFRYNYKMEIKKRLTAITSQSQIRMNEPTSLSYIRGYYCFAIIRRGKWVEGAPLWQNTPSRTHKSTLCATVFL